MSDEYISKTDAITAACKGFCHPGVRCPETPCREQTKYLRDLPSADVAMVVRCKDCKNWSRENYSYCFVHASYGMAPDDFCSYGEKRENSDG